MEKCKEHMPALTKTDKTNVSCFLYSDEVEADSDA